MGSWGACGRAWGLQGQVEGLSRARRLGRPPPAAAIERAPLHRPYPHTLTAPQRVHCKAGREQHGLDWVACQQPDERRRRQTSGHAWRSATCVRPVAHTQPCSPGRSEPTSQESGRRVPGGLGLVHALCRLASGGKPARASLLVQALRRSAGHLCRSSFSSSILGHSPPAQDEIHVEVHSGSVLRFGHVPNAGAQAMWRRRRRRLRQPSQRLAREHSACRTVLPVAVQSGRRRTWRSRRCIWCPPTFHSHALPPHPSQSARRRTWRSPASSTATSG